MGESVPTVTRMMDRFERRYAPFRAELRPGQRQRFDALVAAARSHINALNRMPDLDFERPVVLSMLLQEAVANAHARRSVVSLEAQVREVMREFDLALGRVPRRSWQELAALGQKRLQDYA